MRIENEIKLDFKDVLIRPKRSTLKSRKQVSLEREFKFRNSGKTFSGVPIIASNMDTVATFEMAVVLASHKILTAVHKHYSVEEWAVFARKHAASLPYVAVSTGTSENDFKKLQEIIKVAAVDMICLDVANGYSEHFVTFLRQVRAQYPKHTIMAGNVVTQEMVEELVLSGADIVKVGIGPGSVCTTRKKAGVGYPQLSAVIECADAAHGLSAHIISDGGCTNPGDVAKAFGGGADFVMLGGMLAGHDECGGTVVELNGKKFKEFYGMSSAVAMQKHSGSVANYRASEGKHVLVPYKGAVHNTVLDILGGIRSACTYVGADQLKHLCKRTTFIRVTQQTNDVFAVEAPQLPQAPKAGPGPAQPAAAAATTSTTTTAIAASATAPTSTSNPEEKADR
jgi:GMP reductase